MIDTILNAFDTWTDAQGIKAKNRVKSIENISLEGIARLRELILEMAVRGKLVPHDPADEPASELLKRIEKEKARLVKTGKLRKEKPLPAISDEEIPFELPPSWNWVRLNHVSKQITDGEHITPPRVKAGYRLLSAKNVREGFIDYENCDFVTPEIYEKCIKRCNPEVGDLLIISVGGTIGRTSLVKEDIPFVIVRSVAMIKPLNIDTGYLKFVMDSPLLQAIIADKSRGGAQPCLYLNEIVRFVFPLPPLHEQHRIATKVEELMVLCDRLEASQTASLKTHQSLVMALLQTLVDAKDADELAAAWQRMEPHFDTLFCTDDSIEQLKQTILQLAIMGRLVKQDPADEPASELLIGIEREKERLVSEGKLKKEKALPEIGVEEKYFELPLGWTFTRIGLVAQIKGGKRLPSGHTFSLSETPHIYIQVTNMKKGTIVLDDVKYISQKTQAEISRYTINKEDLYITIAGTIGAVGCVPDLFDGMNLTENAAKIIFNQIDKEWFKKTLSSAQLQRQFVEKTNQLAQPKLALHRIEYSIIPLPPVAEQRRIVAKVDELMALCDALKTKLQNTEAIKVQLSKTVVESI